MRFLRVATLLAVADPAGLGWTGIAPSVVQGMLDEPPLDLDAWVELLRPAATALIPNLRDRFLEESSTSARNANRPRLACWLIMQKRRCSPNCCWRRMRSQFSMLIAQSASRHKSDAIAGIRQGLGQARPPSIVDEPAEHAKRVAQPAICCVLLRLESLVRRGSRFLVDLARSDRPHPRHTRDARLRRSARRACSRRSRFTTTRPHVRRLLLALEPYRGRDISPELEHDLIDRLIRLLRESPHQQAERACPRNGCCDAGGRQRTGRATESRTLAEGDSSGSTKAVSSGSRLVPDCRRDKRWWSITRPGYLRHRIA